MRTFPLLAIASIILLAPPAAAQDFRVETEIFVGKNKEPAAEYLTVFKAGIVYDFMLQSPEEVIIYDVKRGRFVLLDPERRLQAEVTLERLRELTADIKLAAANAEDENVRFLADPVFDQIKLNPAEQKIRMVSKRLTYEAQGAVPPDAGIVRRYADFADGYARLNGLRLGNMPPFARMKLNEKIAEQGWTPVEVVRTIPGQAVLAKDYEVRSHHLYTWKVLPTDEQRMAQADRYLQGFEGADIARYLNLAKRVAKAEE
jgi:hypothetical protein